MLRRRTLLAAGVAAPLAAPALARAAAARVLKFIPEGDLAVVDPVWTTATVTRNHGYLVFDTLYGQDEAYAMQPQMVAGHVVEADGLSWTLTLREGLRFHDGSPVRAVDAVASIRRFAARDAFGLALLNATDELAALDDSRLRFRLKRRFPLLPNALGKTGTSMPCIMPERLARTDPNTQVSEVVGSGPFRFVPGERVPGALVVYERFDGYVARTGGGSGFTAGPKRVLLDRVEWHVIPDQETAAAALIAGQMDWWQQPAPDLLGLLTGNPDLASRVLDTAGGIGVMRFNALLAPFDNPAIRRALLGAVDQTRFMTAVAGDQPELWKDRVGVFSPGAPMATDAGMEVLTGPRDLDRARRDLLAAGYAGEKVVVMGPTDYPSTNALALVGADLLQQVGMNVELQEMDWGTLVQRRASRQPLDKGGWSIFFTYLNGTNNFDPAGQLGIRGNGAKGWFGWPDAPKLEALREAWFAAGDEASQKRICAQIQMQVWQDVPFIPLGLLYQPTAYRTRLSGMRIGFPQFYDVAMG